MLETKNFKTPTIFLKRKNIDAGPNRWITALDLGYGGIKTFSENAICCFPSFARKVDNTLSMIGKLDDSIILYKNDKGEMWAVGELAQNLIEQEEGLEVDNVIYAANRISNPMLRVLADVGLALGITTNEYGTPDGKDIHLMSGLPPEYLLTQAKLLKSFLAKRRVFEIKIGNNQWVKYDFEIKESNIFIMSQPMGSLLSAIIDSNGKYTSDANDILNSSTQVWDGGFKTFDICPIKNHAPLPSHTLSNFGMKRVFEEVSNLIAKDYQVTIPTYSMQQYLKEGIFPTIDYQLGKPLYIKLAPLIETCNKYVCLEMIDELTIMFNHFLKEKYIIITGGTGAAWSDIIKIALTDYENLKIIDADRTDKTLLTIFSNVRGYYLQLFIMLTGK